MGSIRTVLDRSSDHLGAIFLLFRVAAGDPSRQIEAIKAGLAIGAGVGGSLALPVAVRRQRSTEISNLQVNHDATERRITEFCTKAVDQVGADKAPVRLAGLYALERLASQNPTQRQTIASVLCAYLRMPHLDPDLHPGGNLADEVSAGEHERRMQEREVRLTFQTILTTHLHPDSEFYWGNLDEGIDIDLTNATLNYFDLSDCRVSKRSISKCFLRGARRPFLVWCSLESRSSMT